TEQALAVMRHGDGPTIIEADVYRYFHQNGPLPGSAFGYRTKDEEAEWRERDPLSMVARKMEARQLIDEQGVATVREHAVSLMDDVASALLDTKGKRPAIRPDLWPSTSFRDAHIRGDLSELNNVRIAE